MFGTYICVYPSTQLLTNDYISLKLTKCSITRNSQLIRNVIEYTATFIYPQELTKGYDDALKNTSSRSSSDNNNDANKPMLITYSALRNMELLVVARVLSRPEPSPYAEGNYIISKSWIRSALKWLELQQKENENDLLPPPSPKKGKQKKKSKKQNRQDKIRARRFSSSDALPPWPDMNIELACEHGALAHVESSRKINASRRLMDKYAWKILRKLYPESKAFPADSTMECVQCRMQVEMERKTREIDAARAKEERKLPLSQSVIRAFYSRSKGVPIESLSTSAPPVCLPCSNNYDELSAGTRSCPLVPGIYHVIPRSWCAHWRKYIKCGGDRPTAPDASELLCDGHRLPLIPTHLAKFLLGFSPTSTLFGTTSSNKSNNTPRSDEENDDSGEGDDDHGQVAAMFERPAVRSPSASDLNREQLDMENHVVVEILTDDEFSALEEFWPEIHSKFVLSFAVTQDVEVMPQFREDILRDYGLVDDDREQSVFSRFSRSVVWATDPCTECYAGGKHYLNGSDIPKNRNRGRCSKR